MDSSWTANHFAHTGVSLAGNTLLADGLLSSRPAGGWQRGRCVVSTVPLSRATAESLSGRLAIDSRDLMAAW